MSEQGAGPWDLASAFAITARGVTVEQSFDGLLPDAVFRTPTTGLPGKPGRPANPPVPVPRRDTSDLPSVGAILDKYRLDALLGTGGSAIVYRATHLLLQMPVALKLVRPDAIRRQPELAERLCEEARFAALVNHPNVVRVHDVTHTNKITYIVMEFAPGETLFDCLRRERRLPAKRVLQIGLDVVEGLSAALVAGIVHRDIKPANILLREEGRAQVLDLGLALPAAGPRSSRNGGATSFSGTLVGTCGYIAPEQVEDPAKVDFRADIYSLGVSLYQAAVGRPPFSMRDRERCLELHRTAPVPPPEWFVAEFPAAFTQLLSVMLAKDPLARPASYADLRTAMLQALETVNAV